MCLKIYLQILHAIVHNGVRVTYRTRYTLQVFCGIVRIKSFAAYSPVSQLFKSQNLREIFFARPYFSQSCVGNGMFFLYSYGVYFVVCAHVKLSGNVGRGMTLIDKYICARAYVVAPYLFSELKQHFPAVVFRAACQKKKASLKRARCFATQLELKLFWRKSRAIRR